MKTISDTINGVSFLVLAVLIFSLQDVAVKWMGGNYSVIEIVILRTLVSLPFTILFFRFEGGRGLPRTKHYRLELIRGLFLFLSYTTYMMSLAALPLADIAAIRNSAPLMITLLSVVLLGEKVELQRWLALIVGFVGVLMIVKPGSAQFNLGSLFILLATIFYVFSVMITRRLRLADSSATMAYYSSLVYLLAAFIVAPLAVLVGENPNTHPSLAFLFRAWTMPTPLDFVIMAGLGVVWASGMYSMARAYSLALASVVAPFEYVALPINVMWGLLLWREVPTLWTWVGALLTLSSGLYILFRERSVKVG